MRDFPSIVLDTNALIALFDGAESVAQRLFCTERVLVPAIVCGEVEVGCTGETKRERATRDALEKFLALPHVVVVPVSRRTASYYARVYNFCRSYGTPIPTNDLWIAACALEQGSPLLTNDRHLLSLPLLLTQRF